MQNTLLTIAIALILALAAALVAPFVVDWNDYRGVVEREITRATGLDVTIGGRIDMRFLPAPRLTLDDVTVAGIPARALTVELSLGSAMRGELRATDLHVTGPVITLALDRSGKLQWPAAAPGIDPDVAAIDRLQIDDGRVVFTDAGSGTQRTLEKIWFNGDARSLAGPLRGEGGATLDGEMYAYRLNAARVAENAPVRVRLNVDPVNRPLSIEADGAVSLRDGTPRFEGTASFSRPVLLAARGLRGAQPATGTIAQTPDITQPWRASAKLTASPSSVLFEQIEFQYGSDENGVKLTGTADMRFGAKPHIEGVLSARQLDLDRAMAPADGSPLPAAVALRRLAEAAGGAVPFPLQLGVGIDSVTLGGNNILNVRGDVATGPDGWRLSGFEFRAPGFSRVQLAGQLTTQGSGRDAGVSFSGAASVDSSNLKALVAWLEGRTETSGGPPRTLKARGEVTLASDRIAVERLKAEFDRETIEGRVAYRFAAGQTPARMEAELRASEFDIDAARSFLGAAFAGSSLEAPRDIVLAIDLGRATMGGVALRDLKARVKSSRAGLDIERLSVGDLGGASVQIGGRLALSPLPPRGNVTLDLDARDIAGVRTLLSDYVPSLAPVWGRLSGAAKLRGTLAMDAVAADNSSGRFSLDGTVGAVRVALAGQTGGAIAALDGTAFDALTLRLDGKLDTENGAALARLLALDGIMATGPGAGRMTVSANGPLRGEMKIASRLTLGALEASIDGQARVLGETPTATLRATLRGADLRPWSQSGQSIPASASADVALNRERVTLTNATGTIAGTTWRGRIAAGLARPVTIDGDLDADSINAAGLFAALLGLPVADASRTASGAWSLDPVGKGLFADYRGRVTWRSQRAALTDDIMLRDARGVLALGDNETSLEDVTGAIGGGRITARLSAQRREDGLRAAITFAMSDAEASALWPSAARPPVAGKLDVTLDVEGTGRSPNALVGSLHGSGKIALRDGRLAALDPNAFAALTQAVDRGLPVDGIRVRDFVTKAFDGGSLTVRKAAAGLQVANGQIRLQDATVESDGATLAVSGAFDLTQDRIDSRLVLSGPPGAGGRPDVFLALRGPPATPVRTIDVSALTSWLTLRAVDIQSKKLEAIENARPLPPVAPPVAPAPSAPAVPPAASSPEAAPLLPAPHTIAPAPVPRAAQPRSPARPQPHAPLQITPN